MNADQGFELHPAAAQDIIGIWEFIAADSLQAASRVRGRIEEAIRKLAPFPYQGHIRADLTARPLRFITIDDYFIVYAPDETPILVIAVIHGRRSPRIMAAILRGRL